MKGDGRRGRRDAATAAPPATRAPSAGARRPKRGGSAAATSKRGADASEPKRPAQIGSVRAKDQGGATAVFRSLSYVGSLASADELPASAPEVAFIGRSNVGKSSLLNALCAHKKLARTSKTPGRTQRVHLFDAVAHSGVALRLADLPGYGHARTPAAVRAGFGPMIEGFLLGRPTLAVVLLLWDARREPDEDTLGFLLWLREAKLRVRLVVTKLDKIAKNRQHARLRALQAAMELDEPPLGTSVTTGEGVDELRRYVIRCAAEATRG